MLKTGEKKPRSRRRFERYLAMPGSRARFYAHGEKRCDFVDLEFLQAGSVLDISDRGCALETTGQPSRSVGQTGRLVLLRDESYALEVPNAKVNRVWNAGIAVDFQTEARVRRFFSFPKTSSISDGPEAERKQRLAENDLRELSAEALRLRNQRIRMFALWVTATIAILTAVVSQDPAIRNANLGLYAVLTGLLATTFLVWDFGRTSVLNQIESFLVLVNQQLNQGTYLSGYNGWHDALANLQCCPNKFCYSTLRCPEEAWKWARQVKPKARMRSLSADKSLAVNFAYAVAAWGFAIFSIWYVAKHGPASPSVLRLLAIALIIAFVVSQGLVGWFGYSALLGRKSIVSYYCQWFMLMSYCSPFNPNLLQVELHIHNS